MLFGWKIDMVGRERSHGQRWATLVACLLLVSCGGGRTPAPEVLPTGAISEEPEVTEAPTGPSAGSEPEGSDRSTETTEAKPGREDDDSIVIIETGEREVSGETRSLLEAAEAEKERRRSSPPATIVITDKNLSGYATGELTVADTGPQQATDQPETVTASEQASDRERDEAYWRDRAREIRQAWRDAGERVDHLEAKVSELRQEFYAEDDGFYRDSQIKPAWDRAIEDLEAARQAVEERQQELEEFLEEGRRAGVLPGWLREGIELEPRTEEAASDYHEPGEPLIYDEEGGADPP